MPIKIDNQLPAHHSLELENIFVMTEDRAVKQDIRPLKIIILNLMPTKIETETQLLRLLSNSPLQLEIDLLQVKSHISKNVSREHMLKFYKTYDDVKDEKFDGMIVTGAPVEMMDFEEVDYWDELCKIFDWAKQMCIPHLIYAGERRLRFTIITVFRSICFPRRFSAYFAINRLICIIRFCADFLMSFMFRIHVTRKTEKRI